MLKVPINNLSAEWQVESINYEHKIKGAQQLKSASETDKMRNSDLKYLKSMGGPFTKPEEVDAFVNSEMNDEQKIKRLYIEVRYRWNSSLYLPKISLIFRLKENHKNVSISHYQRNLKVYLSKIICCANVSWVDFDIVIEELIAN